MKASFPKNIAASYVAVKFGVPKKASGVTPDVIGKKKKKKA